MGDVGDSAQFRTELDSFMHGLERRNPGEPEFHPAVREVKVADAMLAYGVV